MGRAFSLTELIIVVAILGIMGAIVVPYFRGEVTQAKGAAAKDHLRALRGAIELYTTKHSGIAPGYTGGIPSGTPDATCLVDQIVAEGECLRRMPENPFNNLDTILMIDDGESFPTDCTGTYGWIYQPGTRTMRLDWPDADADGIRYLDY
ncbi:MAG: prepilin-type N-terminal cleavage/methylation domain-containing protein [Phycisphaerales bacterium]